VAALLRSSVSDRSERMFVIEFVSRTEHLGNPTAITA